MGQHGSRTTPLDSDSSREDCGAESEIVKSGTRPRVPSSDYSTDRVKFVGVILDQFILQNHLLQSSTEEADLSSVGSVCFPRDCLELIFSFFTRCIRCCRPFVPSIPNELPLHPRCFFVRCVSCSEPLRLPESPEARFLPIHHRFSLVEPKNSKKRVNCELPVTPVSVITCRPLSREGAGPGGLNLELPVIEFHAPLADEDIYRFYPHFYIKNAVFVGLVDPMLGSEGAGEEAGMSVVLGSATYCCGRIRYDPESCLFPRDCSSCVIEYERKTGRSRRRARWSWTRVRVEEELAFGEIFVHGRRICLWGENRKFFVMFHPLVFGEIFQTVVTDGLAERPCSVDDVLRRFASNFVVAVDENEVGDAGRRREEKFQQRLQGEVERGWIQAQGNSESEAPEAPERILSLVREVPILHRKDRQFYQAYQIRVVFFDSRFRPDPYSSFVLPSAFRDVQPCDLSEIRLVPGVILSGQLLFWGQDGVVPKTFVEPVYVPPPKRNVPNTTVDEWEHYGPLNPFPDPREEKNASEFWGVMDMMSFDIPFPEATHDVFPIWLVSKVIATYNRTCQFVAGSTRDWHSGERNSADFVEDVLLALGKWSPVQLGRRNDVFTSPFWRRLKMHGNASPFHGFDPSPGFVGTFGRAKIAATNVFVFAPRQERQKHFATRTEFDRAMTPFEKRRANLVGEYNSTEWSYFRFLGRMFWFYHLLFPEDERYAPRSDLFNVYSSPMRCPWNQQVTLAMSELFGRFLATS